jgi:hypothetical protein
MDIHLEGGEHDHPSIEAGEDSEEPNGLDEEDDRIPK